MNVCATYTATIWVGLRPGYDGTPHSQSVVEDVCRSYVNDVGLCVTITPTTFVYVGGSEPGVAVGLINYPRFPTEDEVIRGHTLALAERLRRACGQHRVSVVLPDETVLLGTKDDAH